MICNKCGFQNKEDAKFCGSCGNALNQIQQTNNLEVVEQLEEHTPTIEPVQPVMSTEQPTQNTNQIQQTVTSPAITQKQPKKSKKILPIIITIVAAVALTATGFLISKQNPKTNEKEIINSFFDPSKPIRIKDKDDMYRFIDQNGKYTTNTAYLYATEYINNYAIVSTETIKEGIKIHVEQIIDKKGNVKHETQGTIDYHEELDLWVIDNILYDSNLKQISPKDTLVQIADDDCAYFEWINSKNNTGGIMNSKGKITYTYKFQGDEDYISIEPSETTLKEKYCIVNVDGEKYGIVNCDNGTLVYDFTEEYIDDENDNIFEIVNDDTYDRIEIMYIQNDKIIYKSQNEEVSLYYSEDNYITIRDGSKDYDDRYSYIDLSTLKTSKEIPESIEDDNDNLDEWEKLTGYKKISCPTGYGIIEKEKIILSCEWDYIDYLGENVYKYLSAKNKKYVLVEKDNKTYVMDLNKEKQVAELNAGYVTTDDDSLFIYYKDKDTNEQKIYNLLTNKTTTISKDYSVYTYSNYAVAKDYSSRTTYYYNNDGKLIYTEK